MDKLQTNSLERKRIHISMLKLVKLNYCCISDQERNQGFGRGGELKNGMFL